MGQQITEYGHACHIHIYLFASSGPCIHCSPPLPDSCMANCTVVPLPNPYPSINPPREKCEKIVVFQFNPPLYLPRCWNPFFLVQFVLAIQDSLAMCRFQLHRSTVRGDDQKRNGASGVSIEVLFFLLFLQSFSFSSSSSPSSFTHQSWMSLVLS